MGRFGAVSYRMVRQSEQENVGIELNGKDKNEQEEEDIISRIPLAQLSINNLNNTKKVQAELSLKKPGWYMALKMIKSLLPYYWEKNSIKLKIRVVVCVSIIFISKLINLYVPILFKNIINTLPSKVPWHWLLIYGVSTLIQKCIWDLRDILFQDVSDSATRHINLETFDHLHKLSLSFHLNKRTGSLIKIVERGSNSVVQLLSLLLFNIFPTLLELFTVTTFLLFSYGSEFAIINLTCCLIYIFFTISVTEWRTQHRRLANKKENEASDIRVDSLMNFETIKYFTAESYERRRYNNSLDEYFLVNKRSKISYFILNFGQASVIIAGSTFALSLAIWRATQNIDTFSVGDIIAINVFIAQMFQPLSWLGTSYRMILTSFSDIEGLFDLLNTETDVRDCINAKELDLSDPNNPTENVLPSIEFRNVEFSYKSKGQSMADTTTKDGVNSSTTDIIQPKILNGISFTVQPGKSTGLVGTTGAGKSTIFRLLCRFYDVDNGEILVNGQNVRDITQLSLRSAIGVVPQDTVLFNDTIAYNIGFGDRNATDQKLIEAANRAQILPFIESSPEGFRTLVGERGLRLSGGEKQRVSIARALLKDPPILILDEASSALDTTTERRIQHSLNEVQRGRTTLIIAHRLSTVIDCDEILVLNGGYIVERGNHYDLLQQNGQYAHLWNQQQLSASGFTQTESPNNERLP